jgi:hypothetical protein
MNLVFLHIVLIWCLNSVKSSLFLLSFVYAGDCVPDCTLTAFFVRVIVCPVVCRVALLFVRVIVAGNVLGIV